MKKITILAKKEIKILDFEDLKEIQKVIEKLYENNLLDEVLIIDNEKKLTNLPIEFFNEALSDVKNLKEDVKNLKAEMFEIKEIIKELIITIRKMSEESEEENEKENS